MTATKPERRFFHRTEVFCEDTDADACRELIYAWESQGYPPPDRLSVHPLFCDPESVEVRIERAGANFLWVVPRTVFRGSRAQVALFMARKLARMLGEDEP